jgi:hypothetical protein
MKTDDLMGCIVALRALHAERHQELGTRIADDLEAVIQKLERCVGTVDGESQVDAGVYKDALEILGRSLVVATNLAELIRQFFDSQ